VFKF
jgi:hypothetical protein